MTLPWQLTRKIHALVDAQGLAVTRPRRTGDDCDEAEALLDTLGEDNIPLADKVCDRDAICLLDKERNAAANILPTPTGRTLCSSPHGFVASEASSSAP